MSLSTVRNICNEYFPNNIIIVENTCLMLLDFYFSMGELYKWRKKLKYIDNVKDFVEDHPTYPLKKKYWSSIKAREMRATEKFKTWSFCSKLSVDKLHLPDSFISCWLCGSLFAKSSTIVRVETFLMAVEMSRRASL